MYWKLFRLQAWLDALFDDSWFSLGLALEGKPREEHDAHVQPHHA